MMTITRDGNGFKIKISWPGTGERGKSFKAANVAEAQAAVAHYYNEGEHNTDICPLCDK
jgi:hypothetical protein